MDEPDSGGLPIRALQIGEELRTLVYCPDKGQTLPLEECLGCERFACVRIDGVKRTMLLRCRHAIGRRRGPLGALMTRVAVCVKADTHLEAIRRLFLEQGIGGVAVVDDQGRPLGIVSKTDLIDRHHGALARDAMMPFVLALPETAEVPQAAALMASEGIHRLAVTAVDGAFIGMVTSLDVMRWLGERDGWLSSP